MYCKCKKTGAAYGEQTPGRKIGGIKYEELEKDMEPFAGSGFWTEWTSGAAWPGRCRSKDFNFSEKTYDYQGEQVGEG